MKYYKVKKVVTEYTTLSLIVDENETSFLYEETGNLQYFGVNTKDENFINKQYAECEVKELTFIEIAPILKNSRLMKELDQIIESQIAKKYSIGEELKMRDLEIDDPERIEYEDYKSKIKNEIRLKKLEYGLVL